MRNLLENARRHGGPVGAGERRGAAGRRVHCCRSRTAGRASPADERERVFEPFYRPPGAAETGAGYGLGLALVRQIARAHGGEARCLAREGGGTVFEIEVG